jgi:hypothetical protein
VRPLEELAAVFSAAVLAGAMLARRACPASSLDGAGGAERPSAWSWVAPRVGSLSGEGSGPPAAQGSGTLSPVYHDRCLTDGGAIAGDRRSAWAAPHPSTVHAVTFSGGRSWARG